MFPSFLFSCVLASVALTHAQSVSLGRASSFGVIAGVAIANNGPSTVYGDIAVYPGSAFDGFPPGTYTGGRAANGQPFQQDVRDAYQQAIALPCVTDYSGQDLGGLVLSSGVYCFGEDEVTSLSGTLTLDGAGTSNPFFVFIVPNTFTTTQYSQVLLINGVQPCDVFWAAGGLATLGDGTVFAGNIIAHASITLGSMASSNGGLYSMTGSVTLSEDTVYAGNCPVPPQPTITTTITSPSTTSSTTTTSTTSSQSSTTSDTTTSTTTTLDCHADNCLRAFRATQTPGRLQSAQEYCGTYTETTSHSSTPTWVPTECTASRISSACSCIATSTAVTTPTTTTDTMITVTITTTTTATSTTSSQATTSDTTSTSTTTLVCNADNCLRAFRAMQTPGRLQSAQEYCGTYTETTSHSSTPTWVPTECTDSRISSVCSCIATSTDVTTPTTTTDTIPATTITVTSAP